MRKYIKKEIDNYLIPQETCLVFTLSDRLNKEGIPLFIKGELKPILESIYDKITCVAFIGCEDKPALITYWVNYIYKHFNKLKTAWICNLNDVPHCLPLKKMDFIELNGILYKQDYNSKCHSFKKSWIQV